MKKLLIHITSEIQTSPELAWDVAEDYTHFLFLHPKNFGSFDVLFDDGRLQAFYYVSKPFPWLPVGKRFISFRRLDPETRSLDQVYKPVDGRHREEAFFHFQVNPIRDDLVQWEGVYFYPLVGVLEAFPGFFARLFERRIRRVWGEDEEMLTVRHELGSPTFPQCGPYKNPILAEALLSNLDGVRNLITRKKDPDVLFFDFPDRR